MTDKTKASYTTGPWRLGGVKELLLNNRCREIVADDARIGLVYGVDDDDNKANAHLIAAAPDMLQALYAVRAYLCRVHSPHVVEEEFPFLTEVIKKAT